MIKINQINISIGKKLTKETIAHKLHCKPEDILSFEIDRESLDARGSDLHYSYSVYADVKNEQKYLRAKDVSSGSRQHYELPSVHITAKDRPIVVGFGPAGMYSALILAECGLKPIIIERGKPVEERSMDVTSFFQEGILKSESNVQFGEGGAGTFSDGKLTTRIKNIRIEKVLNEFIEAGADPAIAYQHRPHLGTDVLRTIVKNIRMKIISLGGEIHFNTRLESLILDGSTVTGIHTNQGDLCSSHILLCAGHSASDTYASLLEQGVAIEQKDFAAGIRVEHPQHMIDCLTYGRYADHPALQPASYQLTAKTHIGRGVYTFCMCPGGVIIPASTQQNTLAVNGMSYASRSGANANSAVLVQIPRADFDHGHPLDGFRYQLELEKHAYRPHYQAPSENIKDYVEHHAPNDACLETSYPRGIIMEDMHALFSEPVNQALEEGLLHFERVMPGFVEQGLMVGMESRSSSPIRLPRDEKGQSNAVTGLYPCGEGAGYAGGIVSSAVDGIKQAENVIQSYQD